MSFKTPSSMKIEGSVIWLFPNSQNEPVLDHCLGVLVNHHLLIRSASINSIEKGRELDLLVQNMATHVGKSSGLRCASLQLDRLSSHWNLIQSQHRCLTKIDSSFAHLCFPTDPFYIKRDIAPQSGFLQKALKKLLHQFNAEAWHLYCQWLAEDIKPILAAFQPEASEEYQLQGLLEDFLHEVYSGLLIDIKKEMRGCLVDQEKALDQKDQSAIYTAETHLVTCKDTLLRMIQLQAALLRKIYEGIVQIEDLHADLKSLKLKTFALYKLVVSQIEVGLEPLNWGQQLLLLQLLDQKLHVITVTNDETGQLRTDFVFAIRLALAELSNEYAEERILQLCLNWDQTQKDQELYHQFCERVWANCEALAFIGKHQSKDSVPYIEEDINRDFLLFLPQTVSVRMDDKEIRVALTVLDFQSGKPIDCTPVGRRLLRRLEVGKRLKLK